MTRGRAALAGAALLATALLVALGVWQVERLAWKRDLIAQVAARLAAPPVRVPRARWAGIDSDDAYTRVRLSGHWLPAKPVRVKAVTALGSGWWLVAPLATPDGTVLVNRGFVPDGRDLTADASSPRACPEVHGPAKSSMSVPGGRWMPGRARHDDSNEADVSHAPACSDSVIITGLLRLTEPGGAFLRSNDPAADRWFSRDITAIARARGWKDVAPFFVDADAAPGAGWPRGGMTVVRFPNNHLVYALAWFALAALAGWFAWRVLRERAA